MKNIIKNLVLANKLITKQQLLESKYNARTAKDAYFSKNVEKKIVENYSTDQHFSYKFIFDIYSGIKKFSKFDENSAFIDIDNSTLERDYGYTIEIFTPVAFRNRDDVLNGESLGNIEIARQYQDIINNLRGEIPEQDWLRLFDMIRLDIGQVMRHLILIIKYDDGTIMMVHFTHASSIKKWMYTENGILLQEELGIQEIVENGGQVISNPVVISEEFYNRLISNNRLMCDVTNDVNSRLNESILSNLGLNSNNELAEYVLNFLAFVKNLKIIRGVSLYQAVEMSDEDIVKLDEYYAENSINMDMRSALDAIFYMFYKKNE